MRGLRMVRDNGQAGGGDVSRARLLSILVLVTQVWAQGDRVVTVAWYAVSPCNAASAADAAGAATGITSLRSRAMSLAQELPEGMERGLALDLAAELGTGHLTNFCLDPATGDLVARYSAAGPVGDGAKPIEVRVEPQNKSEPRIEFDVVTLPDGGGYRYMYAIWNGANARRSITRWSVASGHGDQSIRMSHPTWRTEMSTQSTDAAAAVSSDAPTQDASLSIVYARPALESGPGPLVSWFTTSGEHPVRAGSGLSRFHITSRYLPGWTIAYVGSDGGVTVPAGATLPNEIKTELSTLLEPENNFTPVEIVGPKFHVQVGRAWIAGNWLGGVQSMVSQGHVSKESTYVAELLGSLRAVAMSLSDPPPSLRIRAKPSKGAEQLLDRLVRLALD